MTNNQAKDAEINALKQLLKDAEDRKSELHQMAQDLAKKNDALNQQVGHHVARIAEIETHLIGKADELSKVTKQLEAKNVEVLSIT
jgi:uncharacterized coiled-coil DUF342 family protein